MSPHAPSFANAASAASSPKPRVPLRRLRPSSSRVKLWELNAVATRLWLNPSLPLLLENVRMPASDRTGSLLAPTAHKGMELGIMAHVHAFMLSLLPARCTARAAKAMLCLVVLVQFAREKSFPFNPI